MHLDQKTRINNQRHAGIVIFDKKILLVKRRYKEEEYYVVPGGHIRKREEPTKAVLREIFEETSIIASDPRCVFEFKDYFRDNYDHYYICQYVSGNPKLGGEELIKNSKDNFYDPMWVELRQIEKLNILPKFAKEWILENLCV